MAENITIEGLLEWRNYRVAFYRLNTKERGSSIGADLLGNFIVYVQGKVAYKGVSASEATRIYNNYVEQKDSSQEKISTEKIR
jgi:hypothetical protein